MRLLAMLLLLVALPARASSLAVLPLTKATGSQAYDGLGKALSGMLVADLSQVDALRLVERDRLDALLTEIELSDGGFVDPATAQKLGAGVGAELVMVGTYSVVAEAFLMDARVVRVETGDVLDAAAASGTVDDFVTVEKDLVEALISELELSVTSSVRRRILSEAPTESFEAFSLYGEGLAAQDEGDLEAARQAFEKALAADPEFATAREALIGLRAAIEAAKEQAATASDAEQSAAAEGILAETVDERARGKGFAHDADSRAGFMLRMLVLEDQQRHCQRYEEMLAHGDRVGWQVALDAPTRGAVKRWIERHGLRAVPKDVEAPPSAHQRPLSRVSSLFKDTRGYVFDATWVSEVHEQSGLAASLMACLPPDEALVALDDVRKRLESAGVGGQRRRDRGYTLLEWLDLTWAYHRATHLGPSDELTRRVEALLAAHTEEDDVRASLMDDLDRVAHQAQAWEDYQARTFGQSQDTLARVMAGIRGDADDVLVLESPACRKLVEWYRPQATHWVARLAEVADQPVLRRNHYEGAGMYYAMARDLGCLSGQPARFSNADEVAAHVRIGMERVPDDKRADPMCALGMEQVERTFAYHPAEADPVVPEPEATFSVSALTSYYSFLVFQRCVDDRYR